MARNLSKKFKADNDTGFANLPNSQGDRLINKSGSYNVIRKGIPLIQRLNFFHFMITMNWTNFGLVVLLFYFFMNVIFGFIYYFLGVEHLNGTMTANEFDKILESFFFSTQTFATVGYGRMNPTGILTNIVASVEALFGVLSLALVTSLLYTRFSRPRINIVYSENLLISPYQEGKALMFRLVNANSELLIDCEVQLLVSLTLRENEKAVRKFISLNLEREKISTLAMNWTIVHPINEESPIFGFSAQDLAEANTEFLVLIKAFDDAYGQVVHTRTSYTVEEMIWGGKFKPMFYRSSDGISTVLELDKISDYDMVDLQLLEKR